MSTNGASTPYRPDYRECYRCEHYAAEHDSPGGKCTCIVLNYMDEESCGCLGFVPEEPPHLTAEWQALSKQEQGDVIRWFRERGGDR